LKLEKFKYAYGRKPKNNKVFDTYIKLPVLSDPETNDPILDPNKKYSSEGYIPDFEYMENYITSLKHKPITTACGANKLQLGIDKWEEFEICELFSVGRGRRLVADDREAGSVPYYSASEFNNGLTDRISNPLFIERDAIIYTTFGDCYYVGGEFTASDEVSMMKLDAMNEYTGLFIACVIQKNKYKYAYGRKAFQNKFMSENIRLPILRDPKTDKPIIDPNNKYSSKGYIPDFEFMERYIKSLPYGDRLEQ
jgi:hypothetical protein